MSPYDKVRRCFSEKAKKWFHIVLEIVAPGMHVDVFFAQQFDEECVNQVVELRRLLCQGMSKRDYARVGLLFVVQDCSATGKSSDTW